MQTDLMIVGGDGARSDYTTTIDSVTVRKIKVSTAKDLERVKMLI